LPAKPPIGGSPAKPEKPAAETGRKAAAPGQPARPAASAPAEAAAAPAGPQGASGPRFKAIRSDYLAGFAAGAPILMGLLPFGLIFGAAAKNAGLSCLQAQAMSLGIFAGSAQLVFLNLWNEGVNALALVLTVWAVNLRLVIYGASLAPGLGPPGSLASGLARGYFLTDESYSISMAAFLKEGFSRSPAWFFLGAAGPTWSGWQAMTALGYAAGSFLPETLPFAMAIPMVFLALLISVFKSTSGGRLPKALAGLTAGAGAVIFRGAPFSLGLILAILAGVAVGALVSRAGSGRGEGG
jgi:predicted branched-subunit amino acid permease